MVILNKGTPIYLQYWEEGPEGMFSKMVMAVAQYNIKFDDTDIYSWSKGGMYRHNYKKPYPVFDNKEIHGLVWERNRL